MRIRDAIAMLDGGVDGTGPARWADLGCGDGTFTRALAQLLPRGSVIHAVDLDSSALRRLPSEEHGVELRTHRLDFVIDAWPFADLDGILMANSLHYVEDQAAFIRRCASHMNPPRRFLIIEYDTTTASPWVPYPVSRDRLSALFEPAGYSIRLLSSRPSIYRRAPLYSAAAIGR
jgi:trans-aconitate methyltransferase